MSGKSIKFDDKKVKKVISTKTKKLFKIDDADIDKIFVFKEELYGANKSFKYFTEYNDNDDIRPLCIMLHQMISYVKCFESNKITSFKVSDNKLLKKYNQIREKVRNLVNVEFDSKASYGDNNKYIKAIKYI